MTVSTTFFRVHWIRGEDAVEHIYGIDLGAIKGFSRSMWWVILLDEGHVCVREREGGEKNHCRGGVISYLRYP
jgi:hypothetical protein